VCVVVRIHIYVFRESVGKRTSVLRAGALGSIFAFVSFPGLLSVVVGRMWFRRGDLMVVERSCLVLGVINKDGGRKVER
jgi:hypothetical protein